MTHQSPFQSRPQTVLKREDLVNYLLQHRQRGYEVFQDNGVNGTYELVLDDFHCIKFNVNSKHKVQVQGYTIKQIVQFYDVTSMSELKRAVDTIAHKMIGKNWQRSPTTARVSENTPATNFATISNLIGTSSIEAIFDPYLENRSFTSLIDILSFGDGSIADGVKVLSTNKTTSGKIPRLSKAGFDAWLRQLDRNGELRIMKGAEHRRFMLLNSGQSLLLGQSLNSIHKNEAIRLEADTDDKAFFNQIWAIAHPIK